MARDVDWQPLALVPAVMALALPLTGDATTWLTLTIAGLAMGMIFFFVASGLTLVFGLMDVLNFGHGIFIALGAFVAVSVVGAPTLLGAGDSLPGSLGVVALAMAAAGLAAGAAGWAFERIVVRPVYGQHLKQILITMGAMIVGEEIIKVIWGPQQQPLMLPAALQGTVFLFEAPVEKFRVLAVVLGALVFAGMVLLLARTKLGLLIRAGVQDREMVEALGYHVHRLFVGVFIAGSALAGLGGVLWAWYQQMAVPQIGAQVNVLIFIVIIIGGLGSTGGALIGALLLGLVANYAGFIAPQAAAFSNIALMLAILLWRPQGLYPVAQR